MLRRDKKARVERAISTYINTEMDKPHEKNGCGKRGSKVQEQRRHARARGVGEDKGDWRKTNKRKRRRRIPQEREMRAEFSTTPRDE